jgi:hypothetical protein
MYPLTMTLMGTGLNIGKNLLFPQKSGMVDPAQYKSQIMPDMGMMRQQAMRNAQQAVMPQMSQIRQYGAAHRLPAGAVMSGLQGTGYRAAQAAAGIEPQLQQTQAQGAMNYYGLQNQYGMGKAAERNQMLGGIGESLGNLTKIGMLWSAGFFNQPQDQLQGWGPAMSQNPNAFENYLTNTGQWQVPKMLPMGGQ